MRLSRNHTRQGILWGCAVLWMGVIFLFSSQTGSPLTNTAWTKSGP